MTTIKVIIGRQNITKALSPSDAGYVADMKRQMKGVRDTLVRALDAVSSVTPEAMIHGAQPMFDESQILVPVDTGKLRASGFLRTVGNKQRPRVELGYAKGGNPAYAALVHERMDTFHAPPTQAKVLEEGVNRHLGQFLNRVVTFMKRETGLR